MGVELSKVQQRKNQTSNKVVLIKEIICVKKKIKEIITAMQFYG
jgi:hypothetical protein